MFVHARPMVVVDVGGPEPMAHLPDGVGGLVAGDIGVARVHAHAHIVPADGIHQSAKPVDVRPDVVVTAAAEHILDGHTHVMGVEELGPLAVVFQIVAEAGFGVIVAVSEDVHRMDHHPFHPQHLGSQDAAAHRFLAEFPVGQGVGSNGALHREKSVGLTEVDAGSVGQDLPGADPLVPVVQGHGSFLLAQAAHAAEVGVQEAVPCVPALPHGVR